MNALRTLLAPIFCVAFFATAALAQTRGEVAVSTPFLTRASGDQLAPSLASNGEQFLAAWVDTRGPESAIYATRLSRTGEALDGTGIRLGLPGSSVSAMVDTAWSRNAWVIFWREQVGTSSSIRFARIDRDGRLVTPPTTIVHDVFPAARNFAAANDRFLGVVYHRITSTNPELYVTTLTPDGQIIRRDVRVPSGLGSAAGGTLVANAHELVVVFGGPVGIGGGEVDAVRVNPDGSFAGRETPIARGFSTDDGFLAASDGNDYLLMYRPDDLSVASRMAVRRVSRDLQTLGATHVLPIPQDVIATQPAIAWAGTHYLVIWQATIGSGTAIQGLRVDRDGVPLDSAPRLLGTHDSASLVAHPTVAANGTDALVAWNDARLRAVTGSTNYSVFDIFVVPVAGGVPAAAERNITFSAPRQRNADVATSGRNHLAVWEEETGVWAGRISLDNRALDGRGIRLSDAATATMPAVVFDGVNYVAIWTAGVSGSYQLFAARITPDGALLDQDRVLASSSCGFDADLAVAGNEIAIVWSGCGPVRGMRIDRNLATIDAPRPLTRDGVPTSHPTIVWSGTQYFLSYNELFLTPGLIGPFPVSTPNVRAMRLTSQLVPLDPQGIQLVPERLAAHNVGIATNGRDFLVTYVIWTSFGTEILYRTVDANGNLLEGSVADSGVLFARGTGGDVIWDGRRYVISVEEGGDLYAIALDATRMPIAVSRDVESSARLLPLANGELAAVYLRAANEPQYGGAERLFFRNVSMNAARPRPTRAR